MDTLVLLILVFGVLAVGTVIHLTAKLAHGRMN